MEFFMRMMKDALCLIHDSHESYKNSAKVSFPSMALNVSLIIIIIKERKKVRWKIQSKKILLIINKFLT